MSKLNLNTILQFLCPDGIELKKLSDVARVERGKRVVREQLSLEKGFPVFQNSLTPMGYHTHYNYEGKTTYVIGAGAAGEIGYSTELFWAADDCFPIVCNQEVCSRYIFHVLKWRQEFLKTKVRRASIPRLSRDIISALTIPVPPLAIQEEIVRILDKYTELEAELEAELEKELEARKKQYEWYRDRLLDFDSNHPFAQEARSLALEDVLTIKNGRDWKNLPHGDIPVYGSGGIMGFVNESIYSGPTVLIPRKGSLDKLYFVDKPFWNVDTVFYTEINDNIVFPKYVFYCLQKAHLEQLNKAGGVPSLTQSTLNKVRIPVPSIEDQQRIADILDHLDALCDDITTGLHAEIAARRKQYEYYRDKLLSFEEVA